MFLCQNLDHPVTDGKKRNPPTETTPAEPETAVSLEPILADSLFMLESFNYVTDSTR